MPRAFDDSERNKISQRLKVAARRLFASQGVLKTTVDELAASAGIAKGSFYSFYANKELLFFEILEEAQDHIRKPLLSAPGPRGTGDRQRLAKIIRGVLNAMEDDPYIRILGQQRELEVVMRRVPGSRLQQHKLDDQVFIRAVIDRWCVAPKPPASDEVAASFTMLVLLVLQKDFFGPQLFPYARDAAIKSFCDCFFKDWK